jgi:hypothetical protein
LLGSQSLLLIRDGRPEAFQLLFLQVANFLQQRHCRVVRHRFPLKTSHTKTEPLGNIAEVVRL